MSDIPASPFDFREQLARIERIVAETETFRAEAARKRQEFELGYRTFWLSAIATAAGLMGGGAALLGAALALFRWWFGKGL